MTPTDIHRSIGKLSCFHVDDLEEAYLSFMGGKVEIWWKHRIHQTFPDSERLKEFYLVQIKALMENGAYTEKNLKHDFNIFP